MTSDGSGSRAPSAWWLVVSIVIWVLAAGSLIAAIAHQRVADQPIGEGEVFVGDVAEAAALIDRASTSEEGVRRARNHLEVEAVSLVGRDGMVLQSTSPTLLGRPVTNPLLAYGVENGRFIALAGATEQPLQIDGVTEWPAGSVLYEVISPIADGDRFVMLHYDVSELLSRRAQPGDIETLTVQLLALGGVFAILGAAVLIGHTRAARRHLALARESELLRAQSQELAKANEKLADARHRAERALALAEEKMRIRSEFVLMINHELRTPLTSVVTGAELIKDGGLEAAEQSEVIDSMIAHGNRLNEMIDQILAVARIENKGITYEPALIPFKEVCAAVDVDLVNENGDADLISVRTDPKTLSLILGSLSDNARTHGAGEVRLHAGVEPQIDPILEEGRRPDPAVFFIVTDDGPGIDPEFLPRAFEKFEKNSFSSGTGLGLYMVRLMVEALGASIGVDTSPEGTTFQVAMPAQLRARVMEAV